MLLKRAGQFATGRRSRVPQHRRHPTAVLLVGGLHAIVGYALVTSMAHRVVDRPARPVEARIVEEHTRPLLPPPPIEPMTVQLASPPPVYVPPPEVRITRPPPALTITAKPIELAPRTTIAPTAPAVVAAAPAPVRAPASSPQPPPRLAKPARVNVASCAKPEYPRAALRAGAIGTTRIQFAIDAHGRVMRADLVKSSGSSSAHRRMDRAAIEALSRCAFEPGVDESGRAIGARATVEYVWQLED